MAPSVVVGEIDRISGSGNGMLRADGEEYNLGPLDLSTVGKAVIAAPMGGTWAVCLTPYKDTEAYLSRFCSVSSKDKSKVEELLQETQAQGDSTTDALVGEDSLPTGTDFSAGDTIEVEITVGASKRNYVVFDDLTVIEIASGYLPAGATTTLELVEVGDPISRARLDPSILEERPQPGTELTVTIREKSGDTGYGVCDGFPVVFPNCAGKEGDELRVGIESVESNFVRASVAALQPGNRPEAGDVLDLDDDFSGNGSPIVRVLDGVPLEIPQPAYPMNGTVPVEIIEIDGNTVSARIDFAADSRAPELGDELTVTVDRKAGSTGYSSLEGIPVLLPECPVSEGATIRAAVSDYLTNGVEATLDSLPVGSRPDVGDVMEVDANLPAQSSSTVLIHDGIPVEISQPALSMEGTLPIEITELRANSVAARVDFGSHSGLSEGTQLSLNRLTQREGRLVGNYEGTPIFISVTGTIPAVPDSIPVTVTEIRSDAVYASIRHRPEIRTLRDKDGVTVTTTERTDEYLIAEYEDYPVWVSWPFDEPEQPATLTVEITEITDCGLFASPPVLPETAVSVRGDILPAQVEEVHTDHISASTVKPVEGEPYVLPVTVPVSFDVSGDIGVEVVDQEQSYLVGIIRTLETGENATQVPVYLQAVQEALLAVRAQQFKTAAEYARTAVDATRTTVRRAEALRVLIFASGEALLAAEESGEKIDDQIDALSDELAALELPDAYQTLLNTELELYGELLSVATNRAPNSVEGLQRIAYNVDTQGRVERIAGQIRRELFEPAKEVEIANWGPRFPHPVLVYRVSQLCDQFGYPPEPASDLVGQYSCIDRTSWWVPPESSPEPTPDESVTVGPTTLEFSSESETREMLSRPDSSSDGATADAAAIETADRSSSEQSPGAAAESIDSSAETTEERSATTTEAETTSSSEAAETVSLPDSDIDSHGEERASTDSVERENSTAETRSTTTSDTGSTVSSTRPPPTTKQLRKLRTRAEAAASEDPVRDTSSTGGGSRYKRAPAIKEYVKARAEGVCEMCGEPAPFETQAGEPYLETHHVDELGQGGEDHPDKVAAVCPTCHKRIHYGAKGDELNESLRERLEDGLANVGVE